MKSGNTGKSWNTFEILHLVDFWSCLVKKFKNLVWKTHNWCNQKDNGFDCSTSSYQNSTNTGPIYMFFTKKVMGLE